jgi:hypothetical protein
VTSIRARVLILTGIAMAMTFIATGVVVFVLTRASLYNQFDEALVAKARALAALVEEEDGHVESEIPANDQEDMVELWADGVVFAKSDTLGAHELQPSDGALALRTAILPDGTAARQVTLRFQPRTDEMPVRALTTTWAGSRRSSSASGSAERSSASCCSSGSCDSRSRLYARSRTRSQRSRRTR